MLSTRNQCLFGIPITPMRVARPLFITRALSVPLLRISFVVLTLYHTLPVISPYCELKYLLFRTLEHTSLSILEYSPPFFVHRQVLNCRCVLSHCLAQNIFSLRP